MGDFKAVLATQTKPCNLSTFSGDLQKQVDGLIVGACAMELNESAREEISNKHPSFASVYDKLVCVVWRGVNTYVFKCLYLILSRIHVLVSQGEIKKIQRLLDIPE